MECSNCQKETHQLWQDLLTGKNVCVDCDLETKRRMKEDPSLELHSSISCVEQRDDGKWDLVSGEAVIFRKGGTVSWKSPDKDIPLERVF